MKKMWAITVLAAALCFGVAACSSGETDQQGANVFPISTTDDGMEVSMGDVMPFYDDGVMNIYHLRNISDTNSIFYHPIARLTTSDYIHYTDKGVALNYITEPESPDAALGTGSFIKDAATGTYHCFYTGHNPDAGIHTEVIRHATSTDGQETWQRQEDFRIYGEEDDYTKNDFRDPYVYYDSADSCYYMLITTREKRAEGGDRGIIQRYTATSLDAAADGWKYKDDFYKSDDITYNMECPSYIIYGDYSYLAFSEQGENRVTHYRYRKGTTGEWLKFDRDSIDASGFYAGRLEKAEDKLFAFAWCARLSGGTSGGFDWGGNLVTHEIRQNPQTGELSAVIPESYKNYFSHQAGYKSVDGEEIKEYFFDGQKFGAYGAEELSENVTRMSFNVTVGELKGNFGLTFGLDGNYNNRLGSAVMALDPENNSITCYIGVSNVLRYGTPLASVAFKFEKDKNYPADVMIDGEVITLYLNGEVALTARIPDLTGSNFAFYSNGTKADIKDIMIYE